MTIIDPESKGYARMEIPAPFDPDFIVSEISMTTGETLGVHYPDSIQQAKDIVDEFHKRGNLPRITGAAVSQATSIEIATRRINK